MQPAPFKSAQIFDVATLGIDPKYFKFNVTHLESDRYVSVKDVDAEGKSQLSII